MNQLALYRDESSFTSDLELHSRRVANFYASGRNDRASGMSWATPSLALATGHGLEQHGGDMMAVKMDQLMNMMTSTQQLMLAQQDAYKRLETHVLSLSNDVAVIKQELHDQGSKKVSPTAKCKVPAELSVSLSC